VKPAGTKLDGAVGLSPREAGVMIDVKGRAHVARSGPVLRHKWYDCNNARGKPIQLCNSSPD